MSALPAAVLDAFRAVGSVEDADADRKAPELGFKPRLLRAAAMGWPATAQWTFEALANLSVGRTVPITWGNIEQRSGHVTSEPLDTFLRDVAQGEPVRRGTSVGYLAQSDLFRVLPALRNDVDFDSIVARPRIRVQYLWIGPAGTITGLHQDRYDNLLAQIRGCKTLLLFPPEQTPNLYPSRRFDFATTISEVDLSRLDMRRYPRVGATSPLALTLTPGDVLWLPRGWWHYVVADSPSISVSCFVVSATDLVARGAVDALRWGLHNLGLVGRRDCVCHPGTPPKAGS